VAESTKAHRPAAFRHMLGRIWADARGLRPRPTIKALVRGYSENDILTYASAMSFQILFALIPLTLFTLGLLGFLDLEEVWRDDLVPELKPHVSGAMFTVIDDTVKEVLGKRQLFWCTFGAVITIWEISGATRAVMGVLNHIYGVRECRSFWRRMLVSCALAAAVTVLVLLAAATQRFGGTLTSEVFGDGIVVGVVGFAVRWGFTILLLLVAVWLLGRYAPATRRPVRWASFGAIVVVTAWVLMSLIFWWYVTSIADYNSIFGSLAVLIVTMEYLYLSAIVFLTGFLIDSLTRGSVEGAGHPGERVTPRER
jgi:membrane protein